MSRPNPTPPPICGTKLKTWTYASKSFALADVNNLLLGGFLHVLLFLLGQFDPGLRSGVWFRGLGLRFGLLVSTVRPSGVQGSSCASGGVPRVRCGLG